MPTPQPSILSAIAPYALTALAVGAPILLHREGISDNVQLAAIGVIALLAGSHGAKEVMRAHKAGK